MRLPRARRERRAILGKLQAVDQVAARWQQRAAKFGAGLVGVGGIKGGMVCVQDDLLLIGRHILLVDVVRHLRACASSFSGVLSIRCGEIESVLLVLALLDVSSGPHIQLFRWESPAAQGET
jgi:hypothetical protein